MKTASIAVAFALLAAQPVAAQLQPNCTKACTVVITMSAACGSGIKVAPDPVVVAAGQTVDITWEIIADGWGFEGPGILIHQPGEAFAGGPSSSKKRSFKNTNKGPRTYKYDVIIRDAQGVCKLDPIIINH